MVEVQYKYNVIPENQTSSFFSIDISTERHSILLSDLVICSSVLANETKSKFIIMEINLQTGYVFSEDDINEIENFSENIKSLQFNEGRNEAIIYFDYNSNEDTCIKLKVRKSFKVLDTKPGWVIVYGAHDKDQKATKSFLLNDF
ncbi:thioester-containing protein 1 allele R1-like [Episyrphus balteatus]|uniref:thioester-containing protein 1 allele R1-like n=1 Tax=Episyrphus balteatus TaxID=286459 RepID=UPI0024865C66|nr:thioester-containing protein 1 allele R1-like [Episyrphus balteatus]